MRTRVAKPKAATTVVLDGHDDTEEKVLDGGRLTLLNGTEVRFHKLFPWLVSFGSAWLVS
jgi:hypothetical protein